MTKRPLLHVGGQGLCLVQTLCDGDGGLQEWISHIKTLLTRNVLQRMKKLSLKQLRAFNICSGKDLDLLKTAEQNIVARKPSRSPRRTSCHECSSQPMTTVALSVSVNLLNTKGRKHVPPTETRKHSISYAWSLCSCPFSVPYVGSSWW